MFIYINLQKGIYARKVSKQGCPDAVDPPDEIDTATETTE